MTESLLEFYQSLHCNDYLLLWESEPHSLQ